MQPGAEEPTRHGPGAHEPGQLVHLRLEHGDGDHRLKANHKPEQAVGECKPVLNQPMLQLRQESFHTTCRINTSKSTKGWQVQHWCCALFIPGIDRFIQLRPTSDGENARLN